MRACVRLSVYVCVRPCASVLCGMDGWMDGETCEDASWWVRVEAHGRLDRAG